MLGSVGLCWKMLDEVWFLSNFSSNIGQHFSLSMRTCGHSLVPNLSAYVKVRVLYMWSQKAAQRSYKEPAILFEFRVLYSQGKILFSIVG